MFFVFLAACLSKVVVQCGGGSGSRGDKAYTMVYGKGEVSAENVQECSHSSMARLYIGQGVTKIGDSAFQNYYHLSTISFLETSKLKTIGSYAFYSTALKSVVIPRSVEYIGPYAFGNCSLSFINFSLSGKLSYIGSYAFQGFQGGYLELPASLEEVGSYAFADSTSLNKLLCLTARLKAIPEGMFSGCTSLAKPSMVDTTATTSIGSKAFENTAIWFFNIPSGVTSIASDAFSKLHPCTGAFTLRYYGTSNFGDLSVDFADDSSTCSDSSESNSNSVVAASTTSYSLTVYVTSNYGHSKFFGQSISSSNYTESTDSVPDATPIGSDVPTSTKVVGGILGTIICLLALALGGVIYYGNRIWGNGGSGKTGGVNDELNPNP